MADLTDFDIDRLLSEAEARLSAKQASKSVVPVEAAPEPLASAPETVLDKKAKGESGEVARPAEKSSKEVSLRVPTLTKRQKKTEPDNAGPGWFNLPRTQLTDELKRDLQLLRMRDVVANGKQYFKKDNARKLVPDFCAVGTLIEGNTDGVNGRLTRKERKRTIVEEVLSSGDALTKFKSKYGTIQEKKMSGRKGYYKKLVAGRKRRG